MSAILAYVDLTLAGYIATFVATLFFSQKIKDFFHGVPAELRSGISSLEVQAKADLKGAVAGVVAKYTPPPAAPVAPSPPKAA